MKLKCLVVDDEFLATKLLESYISKLPQLELVAICNHPIEALGLISSQEVDLLFLDIEMPDMSGMDMLKTLHHPPGVIFITAHSEFALESYELNTIDYLLKPVSFERFVKAVNKAHEIHQLKHGKTASQDAKDYLLVKADHKLIKIKYDEIRYIEGLKEYVSIYTTEKRYVTLESMKNLEQILPSEKFLRIHKSYIVALDAVKARDGNCLEIDGKQVPIGRSYSEVVKNSF